jgi:hypothetical protein
MQDAETRDRYKIQDARFKREKVNKVWTGFTG